MDEIRSAILDFYRSNPSATKDDFWNWVSNPDPAIRRVYSWKLFELKRFGKLPKDAFPSSKKDPGRASAPVPQPQESLNKREISCDFKQDFGVITTRSSDIRTLEDALEAGQVDLETWEVDRYVVNSWEVTMGRKQTIAGQPETYTNYQVKVWLKRRHHEPIQTAVENLIRTLPAYRSPQRRTRGPKPDPHLLEICLFDIHFGKYAWHKETGTDFDIHEASAVYQDAVEDILNRSGHLNIDQILLPVGQDFFHFNDASGKTAAGTQMDIDSRLAKVFEAGQMSVLKAVDLLHRRAPVKIVWVPGNHDPETSYYLCKVLEAWFSKTKDVEVDVGPEFRKFVRYGTVLIGYTHGDEEPWNTLPAIMAGQVPDLWANTTIHEWHVGHIHRKKQTHYLSTDTHTGVIVRAIPSMTGTDAWHYRKGYVHTPRAAEAFLWHKSNGLAGTISVNVRRSGRGIQ